VTMSHRCSVFFLFFLFVDTSTSTLFSLSLHDALPIFDRAPPRLRALRRPRRLHRARRRSRFGSGSRAPDALFRDRSRRRRTLRRSEEHTSELQSLRHLVCRLLLEKKKGLISR